MNITLIANDLVPGGHLPVAAPGLRQWGIAEGLRAHGFDPALVVPRHVADRMGGELPAPAPPRATVLAASEIPTYVQARGEGVVIITNSNQFDTVDGLPDVRVIYDFFAPKVLEHVSHRTGDVDVAGLRNLRQRKIRALEGSDAVLLNGDKKMPYVIAWLLQTDRDLAEIPVITVPMCVPVGSADLDPAATPLRVGIAGYLQAWSQPGRWMEVVRAAVDSGVVELHLLLPPHWGDAGRLGDVAWLRRLRASEGVVEHGAKAYSDFVDFLASMDLVLDLFDRSLEREYAMVTRTVVALAAGRPVVHPSFTEVSPYIKKYEAGWLVDVEADDLADRLEAILRDPKEVSRRGANAHRLASETFSPEVAVAPLVAQLQAWA